jgi:hypothetical protein
MYCLMIDNGAAPHEKTFRMTGGRLAIVAALPGLAVCCHDDPAFVASRPRRSA